MIIVAFLAGVLTGAVGVILWALCAVQKKDRKD